MSSAIWQTNHAVAAVPSMITSIPPISTPTRPGLHNIIIDNPKSIEPITTPTVGTIQDVLVPAFTRLVLVDQTPKKLPSATNSTAIYTKGHFSMKMLRIRRRKMKKHQLKKFRKRMLAFILRQRQKREIRKEKLFRAELLARVREAEQFDAERHVNTMLQTIRTAPMVESKKQRLDKVFDLIREHRKETILLRPKFEDPVPDAFDKLK
jgi:hypothetical protein